MSTDFPEGVEKRIPDEKHCEVWDQELFYRIMRITDIRQVNPEILSNYLSRQQLL